MRDAWAERRAETSTRTSIDAGAKAKPPSRLTAPKPAPSATPTVVTKQARGTDGQYLPVPSAETINSAAFLAEREAWGLRGTKLPGTRLTLRARAFAVASLAHRQIDALIQARAGKLVRRKNGATSSLVDEHARAAKRLEQALADLTEARADYFSTEERMRNFLRELFRLSNEEWTEIEDLVRSEDFNPDVFNDSPDSSGTQETT